MSARHPIALFIPALNDGGAQVVFAQLAGAWAHMGVPIDLVVASRHGENLHRLAPQVNLIDLGVRRTAKAALPLARYIRNVRPLLLMSALEHANVIAWAARRLARSRTPHICSVHNHIGHHFRPASGSRPWFSALLTRAYRSADSILAVSTTVASDVARSIQIPEDAVHVIPNPLDLSRIAELARAPAPKRLDRPEFVAVGRLEPVKDFRKAVLAFAQVRALRGGRLTFLGQGTEREMLIRLVNQLGLADAVDFQGYTANPYPWISRADALVLSSQREAFGMVLAEALALGTQVVSTPAGGGPEEVLGHGAYGHIAQGGEPEALARAMLRALDDPIPTGRLLARAAEYSLERIASRYCLHFAELGVPGLALHEAAEIKPVGASS